MATGAETDNLPVEDANVQIIENVEVEQQTVQDEDVQDDGSQLRAFYDTLKEQGMMSLSFIFSQFLMIAVPFYSELTQSVAVF